MKFTTATFNILKNFSSINENIVFNASTKEIKTITEARDIIGRATITEDIPVTFGIYDLSEFLSFAGMFDLNETEFSFDEDSRYIVMNDGKSSMTYYLTDINNLTYVTKDVKMPSQDVSFTLSQETSKNVLRACSLLGVSSINIENHDDKIKLTVKHANNPTANSYSQIIDGQTNGHKFKFAMDSSNFRFMHGDYDVTISSKNISNFKHKTLPIEYWVAMDKSSTYEE